MAIYYKHGGYYLPATSTKPGRDTAEKRIARAWSISRILNTPPPDEAKICAEFERQVAAGEVVPG